MLLDKLLASLLEFGHQHDEVFEMETNNEPLKGQSISKIFYQFYKFIEILSFSQS